MNINQKLNEDDKMLEKELALKLYEILVIEEDKWKALSARRVPNGWIYTTAIADSKGQVQIVTSTFVPQGEHKFLDEIAKDKSK